MSRGIFRILQIIFAKDTPKIVYRPLIMIHGYLLHLCFKLPSKPSVGVYTV